MNKEKTWLSISTKQERKDIIDILTKEERIARAEGMYEGVFVGIVISFLGVLLYNFFIFKVLI